MNLQYHQEKFFNHEIKIEIKTTTTNHKIKIEIKTTATNSIKE